MTNPSLPLSGDPPNTYSIKEFQLLVRDESAPATPPMAEPKPRYVSEPDPRPKRTPERGQEHKKGA